MDFEMKQDLKIEYNTIEIGNEAINSIKIQVSVANSHIIVEARHGEREDEFGLVERLLIRSIFLKIIFLKTKK